jgi:hypothetical protein
VAFKFNHVMRHLSLLHPVVCHHHLCKWRGFILRESLSRREESRLTVLENRVPRRIFGPKRD